MRTLPTRILILVIGVFIGLAGVAGLMFLLEDDRTFSPRESTKSTPRVESFHDSTFGSGTSESDDGVGVPSSVKLLVFPKRTFAWKERIVSWVNILTEDQILSWLGQSTDSSWIVPVTIRSELQTKLLQKLSITAPNRATDFSLARADRIQRYSMTNIVLQTWAHLDLDGAVARVKELNTQDSRYFMRTIFAAREDLSLEQMREVALELGDESYAFSVYFQNLVKSKINEPRETWYEIVRLANRERVQHTTGAALSRVAGAWVEEQGLNVLDEIVTSISNDAEYLSVLYDILRDLASEEPEEVFDFVVSNLGDRMVEVLKRSGITNQWIQKDPKGLLAKLDCIPATIFRQTVLLNAIQQWADNNPRELLARLDLVPPGQREIASNRAIRKLSRISPVETAQFILRLTDDSLQSRFAPILFQHWTDENAKAAKNWVFGLPVSEPMREPFIHSLTRSLVQTDPRGAFELALQQPLDHSDDSASRPIGEEVYILQRITDQDVQLALELLPKVREGGKATAYQDVGISLVKHGHLQQALGLADQLDKTEKSDFYQAVAMDWLWNDPRGLLREFDDFPISSKSRIALAMTFSNKFTSYYTDEEIEQLEGHISEKDKKMLKQLNEIDLSNPTDADYEKFFELHL